MTGSLPQVNALLLCDQAFQQAGTGKWCIIGTFSAIWALNFPAVHAPLVVFVSLSDYYGNSNIEVAIRDPNQEPVVSLRAPLPALPQGMFETAFPMPMVQFKEPGTYSIELTVSGSLLVVRSFRVAKMNVQPGQMPPGMMPPGFAPPGAPSDGTPPEAPGGQLPDGDAKPEPPTGGV